MEGRSLRERLAKAEARLAEARARLPRHSVPPAMLIEIEDLEEELARLRALLASGRDAGEGAAGCALDAHDGQGQCLDPGA
jgi:hypothetical protein